MNTFLIIIFVVVLILVICGLLYIYYYNKFNESIIRIDEAESRIDSNLRDKYDILSKCVAIIKENTKLDDKSFKSLAMLKTKKLSNFEFDRELVKIHNELISVCDSHDELDKNDELYRSLKQLEIINEELTTLRAYYNANITNYNKMVKKIPTIIIAKIKKYKERLFYDLKDMKDEDYKDFKL